MGAQFTPGPWAVREHACRISVLSQVRTAARGRPGFVVAYTTVSPDSVQATQALANARLIAAAPELLEALARLVTLTRFYSNHDEQCPCEVCAAAKAGETVLAKARGEQP